MLHSACSFLAVLSSMSGLQVRATGLKHSKYKSSRELITLDAKILKTHLVFVGVPAVANLCQFVNLFNK